MIFLRSATKTFNLVMHVDDITLGSTIKTFGRTYNVKELEHNKNIEISQVTN